MLKAIMKKEVTLTNKEIAQYLWNDGSILESMEENLVDKLHTEYGMDYDISHEAVDELTNADYVEILQSLADKITKDGYNHF